METLNAQRQSGDSRPHQLRQVFGIDSAWIRLHRQLSIGMNEGTPFLSGAAPSPLGASGPLIDPAKQFGQYPSSHGSGCPSPHIHSLQRKMELRKKALDLRMKHTKVAFNPVFPAHVNRL